MARKKIYTYWLLLIVVLLMASAVFSVGETQARYVADTLVFNTVVEPAEEGVTSNCLASVSDAPLTVLLGQMPEAGYPVTFTLESSTDVSGSLAWSVDQAEYLNVEMSVDSAPLVQNDGIELTAGELKEVTMLLTPTAKAAATIHEAMDIHITVTWSDTLQGVFRITLPAVTEADLSENVQPTESDDTSQVEEADTGGSSQAEEEQPATEPEITSGVAVEISGLAVLDGRDLHAEEFAFCLYATDDDYVVAEDAAPVAAAVNDAQGGFFFDPLTFETAGTYCYVVTQDASAGLGGITYDDSRYMISVTVTASETETDTESVLQTSISVTDAEGVASELRFENTYRPAEAVFDLSGTKRLSGAILTEKMFSFSLYQTNEGFIPQGSALQTVYNSADGTFAFETLHFSAVGTYCYIICEDIPAEAGNVSYDNSIYKLVIEVEDDGVGQLTARGSVTRTSGDAADTIIFVNTYTPTEADVPVIQLATIDGFASSALLPVRISWVAGVDRIQFGMGSGEEMQPFPAYTRYSLDNGASCYLLYREDTIVIEPGDTASAVVLLDFSRVELIQTPDTPVDEETDETLTTVSDVILTAQAYANQWLVTSTSISANPELDTYYQMESSVLTQKMPLVITLPQGWVNETGADTDGTQDNAAGYTLEYTVEMLVPDAAADSDEETVAQEKPASQYVAVNLDEDSLIAVHAADAQGHTLTLQTGQTLPPAGTYRLNMNWTYEGICFEQAQITFFINYSVDQKQTEQEVPNDE